MNLRTLEKKLPKSKRKKAKFFHRRSVKKIDATDGKIRTTQQRGSYYRIFRKERLLINVLNNNIPNLNKKEDRTAVRRVYYRTLPFLFSRLSLDKDRQILHEIERYYYGFLTTVKLLRNEASSRVSRLDWELRHYTSAERVSLSKQKLY